MASGPPHASQELGRLTDIVEDAQGDGDVVGIDFGELLPSPRLDLDKPREGGCLLTGERDHCLRRIDAGDVDPFCGEGGEQGTASAADIEDPFCPQRDRSVDG